MKKRVSFLGLLGYFLPPFLSPAFLSPPFLSPPFLAIIMCLQAIERWRTLRTARSAATEGCRVTATPAYCLYPSNTPVSTVSQSIDLGTGLKLLGKFCKYDGNTSCFAVFSPCRQVSGGIKSGFFGGREKITIFALV